jgi:hypothetical protein
MNLLNTQLPGRWAIVGWSCRENKHWGRAVLQASMDDRVAMWQRCTMHFTRAHLVGMIPGNVDAWMWMVLIRILVSIRNSLLARLMPPRMCQMQKCTNSLVCPVRWDQLYYCNNTFGRCCFGWESVCEEFSFKDKGGTKGAYMCYSLTPDDIPSRALLDLLVLLLGGSCSCTVLARYRMPVDCLNWLHQVDHGIVARP